VVLGNTYLIGIREKDNFGDISVPATISWDFPPGFMPYVLSPPLSSVSQYFTVPSTSTLQSIGLFTTNFQTGSKYVDIHYCTMELHDGSNVIASDGAFHGYGCMGNPIFSFASSSLVLSPGHRYQWVFNLDGAAVQFYGIATDTAGGLFSDPSLVNARFIVDGDSGVLFAN
jgi:hypothetical protein